MMRGSVQRPFQPASASAGRVAAPRRALVVVAVKPTKAADFRSLSNDEIFGKISDLKSELASVRFLQRTRGIAEINPENLTQQPDPEKVPRGHLNKHLRKQIAQLWTVWRERQLKDNISARESRKLQTRGQLALFQRHDTRPQ